MSEEMRKFIQEYSDNARASIRERWDSYRPDMFKKHIGEAVGALAARIATLSIELANAPQCWNGHSAPLFLRSMVDAYITLAWILEDADDRSMKYILYGLGQEKLFIEHLEASATGEYAQEPESEMMLEMVRIRKDFLNSQLAEWATVVDLGSWSGLSTREMAKQIGRESIYTFSYVPFSGPVHSMWQHVAVYNTRQCSNPLHRFHRVPSTEDAPFEADFMYRSAKYLSMALELLDEKLGMKATSPLPIDFLLEHRLFGDDSEKNGDGQKNDTT